MKNNENLLYFLKKFLIASLKFKHAKLEDSFANEKDKLKKKFELEIFLKEQDENNLREKIGELEEKLEKKNQKKTKLKEV